MNLTISLAQLHIQLGRTEENLASARKQIISAAEGGSNLILLPELWSTGFDLNNSRRLAQENHALLPEINRLAGQLSIAIGGSLLLEEDGKVYNSFILFSPNVAQPAYYHKIHLFRLMDENRFLSPGSQPVTTDTGWGQAGLAVCYDLRFPELFRWYAAAGASLILLVGEWPLQRINHWQALTRARAIENQCFVLAVNCVGETGGTQFGGRSVAITPWGEALVEGSQSDPQLLQAELDLSLVDQVRQAIPVFEDRRPDIFLKPG